MTMQSNGPSQQNSLGPKKKTSMGVQVLAYLIGSCFGLGIITAIGMTGTPGIILGVLAVAGSIFAIVKVPRLRVLASFGAIGGVVLTLLGLGAVGAEETAQARAQANMDEAKKRRLEAEARATELALKFEDLAASSKNEDVLALCEQAVSAGGIPANHKERCGTLLYAQGQARLSKERSEGLRYLALAGQIESSKRADAVALAAKTERDALRDDTNASLKDAQAQLAAKDITSARATLNAAHKRIATALQSEPNDKPLAALQQRLEDLTQKVEKEEEKQASAKRRADYIKESCAQVSRTFGPSSKLSDIQKDELWKSYKGKGFAWNLEVVEVSEGMLGGYTVQFKCGRNSPSLIQDIQMSFSKHARATVMELQKGAVYEVEGKLTSTSTLFGLGAEPL
ncbi:hypothetical protein [Myxococcus virescens]|uniref:Uncharacterized protein n=2 Tax=Myxococcus virescens TaxID=83456 RepID=A0A511HR54_9BACT|nr:hypothetical protein [Myxococcus virescens]GEL74979.1 hypothetical protein MVI01_67630 [Myxococcus virescens]